MEKSETLNPLTHLDNLPLEVPKPSDKSIEYDLFINVYLQAYEEYVKISDVYNTASCDAYFNKKIEGTFRELRNKINSLPLTLQMEGCNLLFKNLKYRVQFYRAIGNKHQSVEALSNKTNQTVDLKVYKIFLEEQEKAFDALLAAAVEKKESIVFEIETRIFEEKLYQADLSNVVSGNSITSLIWRSKNEIQLKYLFEFLINETLIDEIQFDVFRKHFEGIPQPNFINWKGLNYRLPIILDKLTEFIDVRFYPKNGSCSPSVVAKHFKSKGKEIKTSDFSNWKKQIPSIESTKKFENSCSTLLKQLVDSK